MTTETAVRKALAIARVISDYWEAELPKRFKKYPFVSPGEDEGPPPPEEKKLRKFLLKLDEDTFFKVVLVRELGRHSTDVQNLHQKYQELRHDDPSELLSVLMDQSNTLADDWEEGLEILKTHQLDLDKMDLTTAEA